MSVRLLPYRNYSPHDEIEMYSLDTTYVNNSSSGTGFGDVGVFVTVSAGDLNLDPMSFSSDSYLGKTSYNALGYNQYPNVSLTVKPAASGDNLLGITLKQTALTDEHGDSYLNNPQKALENQIVLKGQAVPIAARGEFTLTSAAVDGTISAGQGFKLSTTSGKITGCTYNDPAKEGFVMATGTRGAGGTYVDAYSGVYYKIKLG